MFDLMRFLRNLPDIEYLQYLIAYHAAPTLKRIKPATLICPGAKGRDLESVLEPCARRMAAAFGVEILGLRNRTGALLLLIYQPDLLCSVLSRREVKHLLHESGYDVPVASEDEGLLRFGQNCASQSFPHEIGVLLGYPAGDVRMFMQGCTARSKAGCWRAWSNHQEAETRAAGFRSAKARAAELIIGGASLHEVAAGLRIGA